MKYFVERTFLVERQLDDVLEVLLGVGYNSSKLVDNYQDSLKKDD